MPDFTFLLDDADISGTARLVMAHADALVARGHRVRIVTAGAPPTWRSSSAEWVYVDELRQYVFGDDERAMDIATLPLLVDEEFYRYRSRQFAVGSRQGQKQAPGSELLPTANCKLPTDPGAREHEPLRVLLCGSWDSETHGLDDGYGAIAHARWFHQKLELIRVSRWAPSREEPVEAVQEFHVALTASEMTRLTHSCDVFIGSNRREERLNLPAAEALASGLACVLTAIPAHLSFDDRRDFALFAPDANAVELGERLIELLGDADLRERLRERGREVAERWRY